MTHFAVEFELLDELLDRLAVFSTHLEGVRDEVDSRLQRVHAVWTGAAAVDAEAAHQRWTAGASELQDALATLRTISSTARSNYAAAVAANAQMWSG